VLLCLLAGCQGTSQVFDNPVVGPPPPRVESARVTVAAQDSPTAEASAAPAGPARFELTQFSKPDPQRQVPVTGLPGEVAARVNGTPILVSEVLQPYAHKLAEFRAHPQVTDEEFARMQRNLVQRDLPHYIDTAVLVDAVHSQMNAEQKTEVQKQLDQIFDQQLAEMMRLADVQSLQELEAKLKEAGSSLANELQVTGETLPEIRKSFGNRALSAQYLRESVGMVSSPTRKELLEEYEQRKAEFSHPAKVKWQQLQISFAVHNGADNARKAMSRARSELQTGKNFEEVVRRHGDGPLAKLGGHFDWTRPESVADAGLREALETLKTGDVSGPIETDSACMLVKITESQPARTVPFEEVQEELRKSITERKKQERLDSVVAKIRSKAVIETMFDGESPPADRQESPKAGASAPTS
jgi:parvulin-like peptidyl-prolyl isomerase